MCAIITQRPSLFKCNERIARQIVDCKIQCNKVNRTKKYVRCLNPAFHETGHTCPNKIFSGLPASRQTMDDPAKRSTAPGRALAEQAVKPIGQCVSVARRVSRQRGACESKRSTRHYSGCLLLIFASRLRKFRFAFTAHLARSAQALKCHRKLTQRRPIGVLLAKITSHQIYTWML